MLPEPLKRVLWPAAILLACAATAALPLGAQEDETVGSLIETATSELVLIEVYVSDRNGQPVRDLTIDDFKLKVDRRTKAISSLEFYEIVTGRAEVTSTPAEGSAPDGPVDAVPVRRLPRRFILFFEDATSAPMGMGTVRRAAERFIETGLAPEDQVALVTYDNLRKLEVPVDFTTDRELLSQALRDSLNDKRRISAFTSQRIARLDEIGRMISDDHAARRQIDLLARSYALEDTIVMERVLRSMQTMVDVLAPWPGYKALVYLGEGIPDNPGGEYGIAAADLSLTPQIGLLTRSAAASGVTLHTIKSSGLEGGATAEAMRIESGGALVRLGSASERTNALKSLAFGSGGMALTSNDAFKSLTEMEAGSRAYYLIAYAPEGPPDGLHHSVTVKVNRGKTRVRYRRGFVRMLPEQARERAVQAAHLMPKLAPDLGMELSAIPGPGELAGRVTDLVLYLPAGQLLFLPDKDRFVARVEIGFVALDDGGHEALRLARLVRIGLSPEQVASRTSLGLNFFTRVRLPLADQEITAVIADLQGTSIGAARLSIAEPEDLTGSVLGLSVYSLAEESMWIEVNDRGSGGPDAEADVTVTLGPALRNTFSGDERIACGFRVPPGESGNPPALRLVIRRDEELVRAIPLQLGDTANGSVKVPLSLEGLPSGDYTVHIEDQADGGVDRGSLPIRIR